MLVILLLKWTLTQHMKIAKQSWQLLWKLLENPNCTFLLASYSLLTLKFSTMCTLWQTTDHCRVAELRTLSSIWQTIMRSFFFKTVKNMRTFLQPSALMLSFNSSCALLHPLHTKDPSGYLSSSFICPANIYDKDALFWLYFLLSDLLTFRYIKLGAMHGAAVVVYPHQIRFTQGFTYIDVEYSFAPRRIKHS